MEHPDKKYIEAMLTNNELLLKELYERCFGKIKRFVTKNHGTANDAWDLLQEAMLAIFYKLKQESFTLTCPLDAFIYIVCRNLWLKELRKNNLTAVTPNPEKVFYLKEDDSMELAEACKQQAGRRELLMEKLKELGEGCRDLLKQNWSGLQLNEVAVKLNISYAYARKRKTECMAKLILLMRQSPKYDQLRW